MTAAPQGDLRSLLYLVSLGAVAAATTAGLFGTAYLWLVAPNPAKAPAELGPPAQAMSIDEFPAPADDATAGSTETAADNVAPSPIPGASPQPNAGIEEAPSKQEASRVASRGMQASPRLMPPAGITHAKRVRIVRYHRQPTKRYDALWRPDARAGPHPGGGFYGPPNINIGYINPR